MANNNEDEPSPSAPIPLEKKPSKRGKRHDKERAKRDKMVDRIVPSRSIKRRNDITSTFRTKTRPYLRKPTDEELF